jgi:hypothetical protein
MYDKSDTVCEAHLSEATKQRLHDSQLGMYPYDSSLAPPGCNGCEHIP